MSRQGFPAASNALSPPWMRGGRVFLFSRMSETLKSTHVRLSPEAHKVLTAIADMAEKDNAEMARLILEEQLLGRVHTLMLTAKRYQGMGFSGILRDLEGLSGKAGK